ncbi:hypothetical protein [Campylobacter troglodytis]|nr:hypothetical protein [Campylobacter troglodytis]
MQNAKHYNPNKEQRHRELEGLIKNKPQCLDDNLIFVLSITPPPTTHTF